MYIHELKEWPNFYWDVTKIASLVADVRYQQGRLLGQMENLGFPIRELASLQILTQDALKTSEIEGEKLDVEQVRSSLARRLGIDIGALLPVDRLVEGIVKVMLDATHNFASPLSQERLFRWHTELSPIGRSGLHKIKVGSWRNKASGPMQVVSGPYGRETVHFEAPTYNRLKKEMTNFIKWFNSSIDQDLIVKSAIAHFWFVTVHPFEDGNGRIARALGDLLLTRSENNKQRFYSMSAQIQSERRAYYNILESSQKGNLDITSWLEWYLNCLNKAINASKKILENIFTKTHFWKNHAGEVFNERQKKIINLLLDGFNGKLNSSKWAKITKCSQDTALRDINDLLLRNILLKENAGGRSTSYLLNVDNG